MNILTAGELIERLRAVPPETRVEFELPNVHPDGINGRKDAKIGDLCPGDRWGVVDTEKFDYTDDGLHIVLLAE